MTREQVEARLAYEYGKPVQFDTSDLHAGYYFATDGAEFKLYSDESGDLNWEFKAPNCEDWQYQGTM